MTDPIADYLTRLRNAIMANHRVVEVPASNFHLAFELKRTALCNDAEVVLRFGHGHADAVVPHGDGTGVLVRNDVDPEIIPVQANGVVGQRQVAELVNRIGCVGNNLTQENLFIRVDRVDHQVEKTLGFCLELLFCHFQLMPRFVIGFKLYIL